MTSKPITYNLVIDEERNDVLSMFNSFLGNHPPLLAIWLKWLMEENLQDTYLELLKEMADKEHALEWCKDPDCADKQKV